MPQPSRCVYIYIYVCTRLIPRLTISAYVRNDKPYSIRLAEECKQKKNKNRQISKKLANNSFIHSIFREKREGKSKCIEDGVQWMFCVSVWQWPVQKSIWVISHIDHTKISTRIMFVQINWILTVYGLFSYSFLFHYLLYIA